MRRFPFHLAIALFLFLVLILTMLLSAKQRRWSSDTSIITPNPVSKTAFVKENDWLAVRDLDSFHEVPRGQCITLQPGPYQQLVNVETAQTDLSAIWNLDQVSHQQVDPMENPVEIGACFIYQHVHYEVRMMP